MYTHEPLPAFMNLLVDNLLQTCENLNYIHKSLISKNSVNYFLTLKQDIKFKLIPLKCVHFALFPDSNKFIISSHSTSTKFATLGESSPELPDGEFVGKSTQ